MGTRGQKKLMQRVRHFIIVAVWLAFAVLASAQTESRPQGAAVPGQVQPPGAAVQAQEQPPAISAPAHAPAYRGEVTYGGMPLPGATVTATQGTKTLTTVSDQDGAFQFDDLGDGQWTIKVEMQLFSADQAVVTIAPNMPPAEFEMKLLPEAKILSESHPAGEAIEVPPAPSAAERKPEGESAGAS